LFYICGFNIAILVTLLASWPGRGGYRRVCGPGSRLGFCGAGGHRGGMALLAVQLGRFQLSIAATLGLVLFALPLSAYARSPSCC
jgi:hypothetical protein